MKFTRSWLDDHLDTDVDNSTLAEHLTRLGLEIEGLQDNARELRAFTVAHVLEAKPHPNADSLKLCRVQTGEGEVQIVCGAPNARTGMRGVFAPPGTVIPATGKTLAPATIRGVESNGMLCSEFELGFSDDHDGIIEVDEDVPPGRSFAEIAGLDDVLFHINLTPNRPDCLGVRGIARDLAAAQIGKLKPDTIQAPKASFDCPVRIELEFPKEHASACSLFVARYVRGVANRASPPWLRQRLIAIGLRPIDALVDITNYIAFDRARPLHVYDADKLAGSVRARLGRKGERFDALDGKNYEVDEDMCVIADDNGVLGLGGIIGGESSAIDANSTNVLIESAYFDPARIHRTGRRLAIASDARHRFERGVDPAFVSIGCDLGANMILSLCGGEASASTQAGKAAPAPKPVTLPRGECKRITGRDYSRGKIVRTLAALGFDVQKEKGEGKDIVATPPSHRVDIRAREDLVEEVLRIDGVENIEATPLPRQDSARPVLTQQQKRLRLIRRALSERGMMEAVLWSFIDSEDAARFQESGGESLPLANPISSAMGTMRPGLLPGLVRAVQRNLDRGVDNIALFETGFGYLGLGADAQRFCVAGVRCGLVGGGGHGRHWRENANAADVFDGKADAWSVLQSLGAPMEKLRCESAAPSWYHPGRSGVLSLNPKHQLARFGELHPALLEEMGLSGVVTAFEVFADVLPSMSRKRGALKLSDLPLVRRDFAFVVEQDVRAQDLLRAVQALNKNAPAVAAIDNVRLFDVFTGGELKDTQKSLAIEVVFRPKERTLRDEEIKTLCDKVVAAVGASVGGVLRGV